MKLHHLFAVCLSSLLLRLHAAELSSEPQIHYTLITANSPDCNSSLADNYPVLVEGNFTGTSEWTKIEPQLDTDCNRSNGSTTNVNDPIRLRCYKLSIPQIVNQTSCIQLWFVQMEHRGGFCDCWAIVGLRGPQGAEFDVKVQSGLQDNLLDFQELNSNVNIAHYGINNTGVCRGSASVPRKLMLSTQLDSSLQTQNTYCVNTGLGDTAHALDTFQIQGENCDSHSQDTVLVNFDLRLGYLDERLDSFDEGVEFAFRLCNLTSTEHSNWIPIRFYTNNTIDDRRNFIFIGNKSSHDKVLLRGYNVSYQVGHVHQVQVKLCDRGIAHSDFIQFRWLQTVRLNKEGADRVTLDNVMIVHNSSNLEQLVVLLEDNFNNQTAIDHSKWSTRRVLLKNASAEFGGLGLQFKPLGMNSSTIISREISTVKLRISPPATTTQPTTFIPPTTTSEIEKIEEAVLDNIRGNERLSEIYYLIEGDCLTCISDALQKLNVVVGGSSDSSADEVDLVAVAYLLSRINSNLGNDSVQSNISEVFLSVADNTLTESSRRNKASGTKDTTLAGSTLLKVLDTFALNSHNASQPNITTENIVLEVLVIESDVVSDAPIEQTFNGSGADISIPGEVVGSGKQQIRMASFLFKNVSGLLPESLGGTDDNSETENLRLASPVISAAFLCDNCTTSNLSTPVNITFTLSPGDQALLENDPDGVKCVFWQFDKTERPSAILFPGQWSQDGCKTEIQSGKAVCRCNHLTHFAILLSARPLNLSRPHTLALETISYIGVTVSLIAMAMTILVFIILNRSMRRPLQKIRNYIHIQLCVTLGIAQIIFVAGVKPHYGAGQLVGGVPVGCRLVAVLLHYWFLVSFMWMLMEGVVLYVALVLVFVKHHGRYIATFTLISYGLPLLYVGGLTVPLGFARSEEMRRNHNYDYGYEEACYLNPKTSFIWSLIAPVLLIFLANIGFFIMAVVIMCKHQKRQTTKNKAKSVRHWLKACISLSVVMGITWIIGILVIEVEELFVLAYIFTIFVAFQGVFIFVTFVLLSESKRVKELYRKWWKGKVAESDFLSKHFGEKTFTSTLNSQHYVTEMSTICDKGHLAPGQVIDMEDGSSQVDTENLGTFFDVTFVPAFTSAAHTKSATGEEKLEDTQITRDTVSSDESERQSTSKDIKEYSLSSTQCKSVTLSPQHSLNTPPASMNCNASTSTTTTVEEQ